MLSDLPCSALFIILPLAPHFLSFTVDRSATLSLSRCSHLTSCFTSSRRDLAGSFLPSHWQVSVECPRAWLQFHQVTSADCRLERQTLRGVRRREASQDKQGDRHTPHSFGHSVCTTQMLSHAAHRSKQCVNKKSGASDTFKLKKATRMQQNKTNNQKKQCIVDAKISNGNEDEISYS